MSDSVASAAKVSMRGLELVMPLMSEELLRFPRLSLSYYRLLLYTSEMYPEVVCAAGADGHTPHMLLNALHSVQLALTSK